MDGIVKPKKLIDMFEYDAPMYQSFEAGTCPSQSSDWFAAQEQGNGVRVSNWPAVGLSGLTTVFCEAGELNPGGAESAAAEKVRKCCSITTRVDVTYQKPSPAAA